MYMYYFTYVVMLVRTLIDRCTLYSLYLKCLNTENSFLHSQSNMIHVIISITHNMIFMGVLLFLLYKFQKCV